MFKPLTLLTVLCLSLSACAGTDNDPLSQMTEFPDAGPTEFDNSKIVEDGTKSSATGVVKDIKIRSLPTDAFISKTPDYLSPITAIAVRDCAKEAGADISNIAITFNPIVPPEPYTNPSTGEFVFTMESAQNVGYNSGGIEVPASDDTMADVYEKIYEQVGEKPEFIDCLDAQYQDDDSMINKATKLFNGELEEDKKSVKQSALEDPALITYIFTPEDVPTVKEAASKWKECMAPAGIPDLPQTPKEMPPVSLYNLVPESDDAAQIEVFKQREKEIALQDATCRESSGYMRTAYDVQWALVEDFVEQNKTELQKHYKEKEEAKNELEDYIKNNL